MKNTKKQKNIPDNWKMVDLGDLGKVSMCKRILKEQTLPAGDIPFFKIGTFGKEPDAYISKEIYKEFREKYSFPKMGDILISASGTIGRTVIYDGEPSYFQDSNIIWIANDEDLIKNSYLSHLYKRIRWSTASGTIARLYNDLVRSVSVMAPTLPEQNRIVSVLETWDSGIEKLKQKIAIKKEIKKGLMQELLTGKKRLPGFSGEWKIVKLGDFSKINKGKALSSKNLIEGNYPVIAGGKTSPYSHASFCSEDSITVSASGAYAGYVAYHNYKFWGSDCSILNIIEGVSDIHYIKHYLTLKQERIYALQTGGAQPHVYPKDLNTFKIDIPSSLKEQEEIVKILNSSDSQILMLEKKLNYWLEQKKYLLNNLVTGQLRTPENLLEITNHK